MQASVTDSEVREALEAVIDPELHKSLIELGMIREVRIENGQADIGPAVTTLASPLEDQIVGDVEEAVGALQGVKGVEVELTEMTDEQKRRTSTDLAQHKKGAAVFAFKGTRLEIRNWVLESVQY